MLYLLLHTFFSKNAVFFTFSYLKIIMLKKLFFASFMLCALWSCDKPSGENTGTTNDKDVPAGEPKVTETKDYVKPEKEKIAACASPKSMRELSGGMKKVFYQFTSKNAANLSLFGMGNLNLGKKEVMVIVDFMQYKDQSCSGSPVRYGVGARLFLHIKKLQGGVQVTDLTKLAAGVELGKASITYSIEVIGLTGDKIRASLPATGDFDVEAYGKVISAVDKIQMLASDQEEGIVVDPQVIPTSN
jgi:hypothetical protein